MEENTLKIKYPFAGFFKRGLSVFIDLFLVLIGFLILNFQFLVSASWNYTAEAGLVTTVEWQHPINALLFLIVLIIYFTLTEFLWGASIGKLIFRERVVGLQKEKISFGKALLRNVFVPIDLILGPAFFLFSKKNQTLGDKIANTVVINKKLADLPITDKPVSLVRKIFAVLFVVMIAAFFVLILWTIPKISSFNEISRVTIENVQEGSGGDMMGLYNSFASEFRDSITFEEFEQIFNSPEFRDVLANLDANKIVFFDWQFNNYGAVVAGQQDNIIARLSFIKNNLGEWKLLGFRLIPNIKSVSLLELFTK